MYRMSEYNNSNDPLSIIWWCFVGFLTWTLAEYLVHRFVFHCEDTWLHYVPHNSTTYVLHFIIHGIHHAFPQDRKRIVFPPIPGQILIFYPLIYAPLKRNLDPGIFYNVYLGLVVGYQVYEMIHYTMH